MITVVPLIYPGHKATPKAPDEMLTLITEVKKFYGIREQCLEALLLKDGLRG